MKSAAYGAVLLHPKFMTGASRGDNTQRDVSARLPLLAVRLRRRDAQACSPSGAGARGGNGAKAARGQRAALSTSEAGAEEGASAEGGWGLPCASSIRDVSVLLSAVWGPAQGAGVPNGAAGSAGDIGAPGLPWQPPRLFPAQGPPERVVGVRASLPEPRHALQRPSPLGARRWQGCA